MGLIVVEDIREVADYHRYLSISIFLHIFISFLLIGGLVLLQSFFPLNDFETPNIIITIVSFSLVNILIANSIAYLFLFVRLVAALGASTLTLVLAVLSLLMPCIAFIWALIALRQGAGVLKRAGYKVGTFGISTSKIDVTSNRPSP